ncbi:MAG: hypothetical protein JWN01_1276 [Patescibacteria group bacterium]|nr:hypothetical protein [Patescibacteria group bacterium]
MNKLPGTQPTTAVPAAHFECGIEDGYVYERIWGKIQLAEAEKSAARVIALARESGHRLFLLDIDQLEWIDSLSVRKRGLELMHQGKQVFDHLALVSRRPAITYLVSMLATGAGLDTKGFSDKAEAVRWLRSK